MNSSYARALVETQIRTITPTEAEIMLATTPPGGNRHLRLSHVDTLATLIRKGHWIISHQGVGFNKMGQLIDGQHRLSAIVQSNTPVQIMVTLGLDTETLDAVDRGSLRTIGDIIQITHGIEGGNKLTAACRVIQREFNGNRQSQTVAGVMEIYRRHQPGLQWTLDALPGRAALSRAPVRAAFAIAYQVAPDPQVIEEFARNYISGAHIDDHEPAWRLRELVSSSRRGPSSVHLNDAEWFAGACYALKAHIEGKMIYGVQRKPSSVEYFRDRIDLADCELRKTASSAK